MAELIKNIEKETVFKLVEQVKLEGGKVNSLTLAQTPATKITVFAIDADEGCPAMRRPATRSSRYSRVPAKSRSTASRISWGRARAPSCPPARRMRCVASPRSKCCSWWYWLRRTADGKRKGGATTLDEMEKAHFEPNVKGGGSNGVRRPFSCDNQWR